VLGELIEKDLDEAIRELKKLKSQLPLNLYDFSSRHYDALKAMLAIIEGMDIPTRIHYNAEAN
jgi:hypothetical protein|tara:strand:- start:365 stop:553 length:189 start_codon:yes stop_codon:yes gene_type:complete